MTDETSDLTPMIRRAALLFVAAELLYASAGAMTKVASLLAPHAVLLFVQLATAFLLFLPYIIRQRCSLATKRPITHLLRALALTANFYLLYWAIRYIPVSDALLLNNTLPLFVPLIVWLLTGKRLRAPVAFSILIGFLGVVCILKPGIAIFQPASLLALLSAVSAAVAVVLIGQLATTEPLGRIFFYTLLIPTVITGLLSIPYWQPLPATTWLLLIGTGAVLALFQFLLTSAFASAPPGPVSAMAYTAVFFGGLIDWIFWHHRPDIWFLIGTLFIVAGGLRILMLKEKRTSSENPGR